MNLHNLKPQGEENREFSALDTYLNRVYKFVVLAPTSVAMSSAIGYTIDYIVGWYDDVSLLGLIIFDITNIIYMAIALYFFFTGIYVDGELKKEKLRKHKIAVSIVILIQWNFTAYLIPAADFWAYAPFFALFAVFFFDTKMVTFVIAGLSVSTILSYFIRPELLFVDPGKHLFPDAILRMFHLGLSMLLLYALTYFGEKYLVEELERNSNYDTLTRLLNRRSLDGYLKEAYKKAATGTSDFSVMMIDIDNFKKVNDTYGHDCGDVVLKYVAQTVSTGVKKDDIVFRWGGEEIFVILMANEYNACKIADRIRKDIESSVINYRNECTLSVTVTIGVSEYEDCKYPHVMMDEADERLYWGKQHGKNRVVGSLTEREEKIKNTEEQNDG